MKEWETPQQLIDISVIGVEVNLTIGWRVSLLSVLVVYVPFGLDSIHHPIDNVVWDCKTTSTTVN